MEEPRFFKKQPGSRSLTVLDNPKDDYVMGGGKFNIGKIAKDLREDGDSEFSWSEADLWGETAVKPPKPYVRFKNDDSDVYDTRDEHYPSCEDTDIPSIHFHRAVRHVTAYRVDTDMMQDVTPDGGVKKRVLREGTGMPGEVYDGCRVWIHYESYLDNGAGKKLVMHDSTADHKMATSMIIGKDGLLGLQVGLKSMRTGEVAELALSPDYAYGALGIPGFVGKLQALRIVVELREIREQQKKSLTLMAKPERDSLEDLTMELVMTNVEQLIRAGKKKFIAELYRDASDRYNWALELFQAYPDPTKEEERKIALKSFQLYSNLAMCYIKMEDYDLARASCETALKLAFHPVDLKPKVLYRLALVNFKQQEYDDCITVCNSGLKQCSWGRVEFRDLKHQAIAFQRAMKDKNASTPGIGEISKEE